MGAPTPASSDCSWPDQDNAERIVLPVDWMRGLSLSRVSLVQVVEALKLQGTLAVAVCFFTCAQLHTRQCYVQCRIEWMMMLR